ncbi:MAG: alpha/beta hydrolase [bacterium]|nr:alpha/beta hydrolase [bacterium]
MRALLVVVLALVLAASAAAAPRSDVFTRVRHGYADSDGVPIHYAALGRRGPLIVMIHGFPDFWYSWRDQMAPLSRRYRVVAMDLRGYNLSGQPSGVASYALGLLVNDVAAVIRANRATEAIVVGHDWGGAVAWSFAMTRPEMTTRLIILNSPHPRGLLRELRENPRQEANSAYARFFQQEGSHLGLTPESLASGFADPTVRARYAEAFRRSSFEGMVAYYKANYPRAPYADLPLPAVTMPTLVIHGLRDQFLLADCLDGMWNWVARGVTLVTVPEAAHFVQHDAPALVTKTIKSWLASEGLPR